MGPERRKKKDNLQNRKDGGKRGHEEFNLRETNKKIVIIVTMAGHQGKPLILAQTISSLAKWKGGFIKGERGSDERREIYLEN